MNAKSLTANLRESFVQNVFRIVDDSQLIYECINVQAVVRIGRLDFVAVEKRQEGELIVRHIDASFKQGIVIDEPTFDEVFLHGSYFAIVYKGFTKKSGVVLVAQQDQMTSVDDTPCLIDSYPGPNVVWANGSEHLLVSSKRDLWHWTPSLGKLSFFLTLEIPGYVSLHDGAQISWSPDDRFIACISGITTGEVSRPKGMHWDKHAHRLAHRSVADLAFVDVERREIVSRFQFKTVKLLGWNKSSELVRIRVRDESHGDPHICYVIDPRTGDREQGNFPADQWSLGSV